MRIAFYLVLTEEGIADIYKVNCKAREGALGYEVIRWFSHEMLFHG